MKRNERCVNDMKDSRLLCEGGIKTRSRRCSLPWPTVSPTLTCVSAHYSRIFMSGSHKEIWSSGAGLCMSEQIITICHGCI